MLMAFSGTILPTKSDSSVHFEPLIRTSTRGGTMEWDEFTEQSFDIFRMQPTVRLKEDRPHVLDPDPQAFVLAAHITSDGAEKLNAIFVADLDCISDWFFLDRSRGESNLNFDNVTFVLDAVDVLAGQDKFLELRKRRAEFRTLTAVEKRTAKYAEERIRETKDADDEAKKLLSQAQHKFDEKRQVYEKDPTLSPEQKDELIRRLKEGDERRLQVAKAEIDLSKQRKIDEIKNETERRIRETERGIMLMAVIFPPIPAVLLGSFIFFRRLSGERRHIAPERLAREPKPA
jgi:ABC-2 type transport system permease protein